MTYKRSYPPHRLEWLEGIRFFGAVLLLLCHAQLVFTIYAYTPQPNGLVANIQQLLAPVKTASDWNLFFRILSLPIWFGFQFIDVFVLVSGFCLVLSQKGKPRDVGSFLSHRLQRLLFPFWTVVVLSFPVLCALRAATGFAIPSLWQMMTAIGFPLLPEYNGESLLEITSSWGMMPLILSFAVVSPLLMYLLRRWGAANLLLVSGLITLGYRILTVYQFDGHPAYALAVGPGWYPFVSFLAKLSTFVVGMVAGQAYCRGRGPVFWKPHRALLIGTGIYMAGFTCQFYRWGWVLADLLLPIGLGLLCMVVFRALSRGWLASLMLGLGTYSYAFFLISSLVVDYTNQLLVQNNGVRFILLVPAMILGTLVLAILAEYVRSTFQRVLTGIFHDLDFVLSRAPIVRQRKWRPQPQDAVRYQGKFGWKVVKVEKLLDEREFFLCQISDGQKTLWVNENDLEPADNGRIAAELNH
jgi:hypothetical protein